MRAQFFLVTTLCVNTLAFLNLKSSHTTQFQPKCDKIALFSCVENLEASNEDIYRLGEEEKRIKILIHELSMIESDDIRRSKLEIIFGNEFKNDKTWNRFVELFDNTLSVSGQSFQAEQNDYFRNYEGDKNLIKNHYRAAKLRLWAFVDMTVQSKTLTKKKNGTLGFESIFG